MKNQRNNLHFFKTCICFLLGFSFLSATLMGHEVNKHPLTENWEFVKGDLGSVWEAWRGGKYVHLDIWSPVQLPHCFNAVDAVDPDVAYYQGAGWYKTLLEVKSPYTKGRILLHFEGAGQKTDVYVYTEKVGSHVGGYDEFTIDLTDAIQKVKNNKELSDKYKGRIPIAIRCDNTRDVQMIPSDLSDFNVYGGLYRNVNLVYVPAVSAERIYINATMDLSTNIAEVSVSAKLNNPKNYRGKTEVSIQIKSPDDKVINTINQSFSSWKQFKNVLSFEIEKPQLWSPDSPDLYECLFTFKTSKGEHTISENFGIRHFEFVKKGPFKLNGERLLLRGTHRHEDHAGTAAAMTEDMIVQEMKMMKEMGVNFIRLGHYQQSRIVLEQCDKLGILVWEEIPWCRGGLGNETYKEQASHMLRNMIDQHRNHPSIIIWGLGNENDWPGDFEVFDKDKIRTFMQELQDLSHQLDDSRKTAIRRCDFCKDIVDVYSPSIWAGWYRGKYTQYKEVSKKEMEEVDHYLHVEWGASNHARRHSESPDKGLGAIATTLGADERSGDFLMTGGDPRVSKDGDWSETYACNLIDWHLKEQETMPWLTGTAYWPFKDFSTPIRPENPVPYVNQKGVVERDFTKKEGFYVFQSYWTEEPMAHIYGHTWTTRWGEKNENKMVKVYSNCPEAELFLNGKAMGTKKRDSQNFPAAGLRWIVKFKGGENHLKVVAQKDGQKVIDEIILNYQEGEWDKPSRFVFETISQENDTALLRVNTLDKNGLICLDAKNQVHFQLSGDGKLIDNLGTSTGSNKVQLYNGCAMIKVKLNDGKSVVSVSSDNLPSEFVKIRPLKSGKSKLNVLLIAIDDFRPELGCYGAEQIKSPNIDLLAAEGVLFNKAYTQQAVCAPSRNTLMTGMRPDALGITNLGTFFRTKAPDVVTLSQHFLQNGYQSEGMGKIYHTGHGNSNDTLSWTGKHWTPAKINKVREAVQSGDTVNLQTCYPKVDGKRIAWLNSTMPEEMHDDALTTTHAIERMEALKDSAFFLAVGLRKPHLPFVAPKKYWDLYDVNQFDVPSNEQPESPNYSFSNWGELRKYHGMPSEGYMKDEDAKNLIHGYHACVSFVDAQVGRLVAKLKALDLYDNTIIVLWGDHGYKLGDYGEWCKHTNYEIDTRIPVVVRTPQKNAVKGVKSNAIIETVDIYPTLCQLAGLDIPDHVQGSSFGAAIYDENFTWDEVAFSQYPRKIKINDEKVALMGYTMRTPDYRFTKWVNKQSGETIAIELYDHTTQHSEMENLADDPDYKELLNRLNQRFEEAYSKAHR